MSGKNIFWYNKSLRIIQTVQREIDAVDYNSKSVINYLIKSNANCLVLNGGGIIDFFNNPLPFSNKNKFLTKDYLTEIITLAHKNNIRVILRVDFRGVEESVYNQNPSWFAQSESGNPIMSAQSGYPLYAPCYNSKYTNEHAVNFINYLFDTYNIDGIWHNCIAIWGKCHCNSCKDKFKKDNGSELLKINEMDDVAFEKYRIWKEKCAEDYLSLIQKTVKSHGQDKAYAAEIFGMYDAVRPMNTGLDLYVAEKYFDFLVCVSFLTDNKPNAEWEEPGYSSSITKFMKSLNPNKQSVLLYGTNGTTHRYVMDPPIFLKNWIWDALSTGASFWNCLFNGQHPAATLDNRNAFLSNDAYSFLKQNEKELESLIPYSEVAVFYSKPTREMLCSKTNKESLGGNIKGIEVSLLNNKVDLYSPAVRGVEKILLEKHIQYTFLCDYNLSIASLKKCKLLILPNIACLSNLHANIIREFVKNGGTLIASYQTSLFDEKGLIRNDFELNDLFGTNYLGNIEATNVDCYQLIRKKHPLLKNIKDTKLLINGGNTLLCSIFDKHATMICSHVPIISNQPPEKAWRHNLETENPTIVVNKYGKGKVVYFANQTDMLCLTNGHNDFKDTFSNAIDFCLNKKQIINTNAPSGVHIHLLQNKEDKNNYLISLVNYVSGTSKPITELVEINDITIELQLEKKKLKTFKIVKKDAVIKVNHRNGKTKIVIKKLKEFNSILLNY